MLDKEKYELLRNQVSLPHAPPDSFESIGMRSDLKSWIVVFSGLPKGHFLKKGDEILRINDCTLSYYIRYEYNDRAEHISKHYLPIQYYVATFPNDLYGKIINVIIKRNGKKITFTQFKKKS